MSQAFDLEKMAAVLEGCLDTTKQGAALDAFVREIERLRGERDILRAACQAAQPFLELALGEVDFAEAAPGRFDECAAALQAVIAVLASGPSRDPE